MIFFVFPLSSNPKSTVNIRVYTVYIYDLFEKINTNRSNSLGVYNLRQAGDTKVLRNGLKNCSFWSFNGTVDTNKNRK